MLEPLSALDSGRGGQGGVLAWAGLDRGFLIAADDVVAGMQELAFPAAAVQVEDRSGLGGELGVAGERSRSGAATA
ncbi:MAG TPA: hypothetical protein VGH56_09045 [Solirubrobacteraceae bacterium]